MFSQLHVSMDMERWQAFMLLAWAALLNACLGCQIPTGYVQGSFDPNKAYKMSGNYLNFNEAWEYCQSEGAWPVMIKTSDDSSDILFYSVQDTWVGLTNPNLTLLNDPTGAEVESAFKWIDGTSFSHSSSYTYNHNNGGVFCNRFVNNGGNTFGGSHCSDTKKVLCQLDCSNLNAVYHCPNGLRTSKIGYMNIHGKYYKIYANAMHFYSALSTCQQDHGTLAEFQTTDDYKAVQILDDFIGEEFWTGLLNPNGTTCKDDNCHNQLSWSSDGSLFLTRHSSKVNMNLGELCSVYRANSGNVVNRACSENKKFACQFSCDSGICPSGSDHLERPQKGYVYIGSTGKHYRPRKDQSYRMDFHDALMECHKDGATLVEYQTEAEFQVVKRMMEWVGDDMWIGLMNKDGVDCSNDACINKLEWLSDGSSFATRHSNDDIKMDSDNEEQPCIVFMSDRTTRDKGCTDQKYFACQFSCNNGNYVAAGSIPPPGYIYHPPTDKYYLPGYVKKNWHDSQLQCSTDGATLMEFKTAAEHDALQVMQRFVNDQLWTGLTNPDLIACNSANECDNKLYWSSDGNLHDTSVNSNVNLRYNNGRYCARYSINYDGIDDYTCASTDFHYVCEFSCNRKKVHGCPTSMNYLNLNGINIKMGNGEKSFADALGDCQSDGGQLAKISSSAEFTALKLIHGFDGKPNNLWVGLTNPDGVNCVNSGCTDIVEWADGTNFKWDQTIHSSLEVSAAVYGYGFNVETRAFSPHTTANYVCVASCMQCDSVPPDQPNSSNDYQVGGINLEGASIRESTQSDMLIVPLLKIFPFLTMNNDPTVADRNNVSQAMEADKKCIAKVLLNGGSTTFVARLESLLAVNRTVASENVVGYNHVNETTDNKERCLVKAKAQGASANFLARLEKLLHIGHTHGAHHVLDSPAFEDIVRSVIIFDNFTYLSKFQEHLGFFIAGNAGPMQQNGLHGEIGNKTLEQCARKCYLMSKACNCGAFSYSKVYQRCILEMRRNSTFRPLRTFVERKGDAAWSYFDLKALNNTNPCITGSRKMEAMREATIKLYMKPASVRGGVVQLKILHEWVTISHHGINPKAINLICRDLGFHRNLAPRSPIGYQVLEHGNRLQTNMYDINCPLSARHVTDCEITKTENSCNNTRTEVGCVSRGRNKAARIFCPCGDDNHVLFEKDQFDCIHKSYMCNGVNDTSTGIDEDEETCRKVKEGNRALMGV